MFRICGAVMHRMDLMSLPRVPSKTRVGARASVSLCSLVFVFEFVFVCQREILCVCVCVCVCVWVCAGDANTRWACVSDCEYAPSTHPKTLNP